jgi:hypothetical protein
VFQSGCSADLTSLLQRFQFTIIVFMRTHFRLDSVFTGQIGWSLLMKESRQISLGSSDSTAAPADFKYSMRGKVISITYLGPSSVNQEIVRILRKIEYWHQGSITSFRILHKDADGLEGDVGGDGENAEIIAPVCGMRKGGPPTSWEGRLGPPGNLPEPCLRSGCSAISRVLANH